MLGSISPSTKKKEQAVASQIPALATVKIRKKFRASFAQGAAVSTKTIKP
jgi:hypothetical protein